jgi:hypothetical protein
MAQDLLADFNALHNQPANALGTAIAPMVLYGGHRMIKFPQAETRAAYFKRILPLLYNGLGITVNVLYTFPANSGAPQLSIAFERHEADVFLFTGANFANSKVLTLTAPTVANAATYASLDFADGTEIGSLVALEGFRLRVERVAADGVAQPVYVSQVFLTNTG